VAQEGLPTEHDPRLRTIYFPAQNPLRGGKAGAGTIIRNDPRLEA
jgi:hypothetical protein